MPPTGDSYASALFLGAGKGAVSFTGFARSPLMVFEFVGAAGWPVLYPSLEERFRVVFGECPGRGNCTKLAKVLGINIQDGLRVLSLLKLGSRYNVESLRHESRCQGFSSWPQLRQYPSLGQH